MSHMYIFDNEQAVHMDSNDFVFRELSDFGRERFQGRYRRLAAERIECMSTVYLRPHTTSTKLSGMLASAFNVKSIPRAILHMKESFDSELWFKDCYSQIPFLRPKA